MVNASENGSENVGNFSLFSSSECIAWLTIFITESVAITTLNICTIIVFIRSRSLRKRSMYLVINLAVADMLVGGFTEVVHLASFGAHWTCNVWRHNLPYLGDWGDIKYSIRLLFLSASLTNLAAISLERMHATFRPFKHRVIKNWVLGVVIMVTWVIAGLVLSATTLIWRSGLIVSFHVRSSSISICLLIIFASYTSIVVKVYCGAHPQHHGTASRERKLAKTLFIVTLVSLITWLPYVICSVYDIKNDTLFSLPFLISVRLETI